MNSYFSVIIPTLNEEKYLPKLLGDLSCQKDKNFEVIIVDGDSEDKTKEVAKSFEKKLNISFLINKKRNVSFQRNFGASKSKGNYLIFIDADARVSNTFIKKLNKEIKKSAQLVYIPAIIPQNNSYQDRLMFNLANFIIDMSQKFGKPFSSSGSMIFEKNFFMFINGFDEKLFISEDHEIIQRSRSHGVIATVLKNNHLKFSLRRMDKEGRLSVLIKYLISSMQTIKGEKINKKIYSYEMGGQIYSIKGEKEKNFDVLMKKYFKNVKKQLKDFIQN